MIKATLILVAFIVLAGCVSVDNGSYTTTTESTVESITTTQPTSTTLMTTTTSRTGTTTIGQTTTTVTVPLSGDASPVANMTAKEKECNVPGDSGVILGWIPAKPAGTEQRLEISTISDFRQISMSRMLNSSAPAWTETSLSGGGINYYWRVNTLYSSGWLIGSASSFQYEGCTGVDQTQNY